MYFLKTSPIFAPITRSTIVVVEMYGDCLSTNLTLPPLSVTVLYTRKETPSRRRTPTIPLTIQIVFLVDLSFLF